MIHSLLPAASYFSVFTGNDDNLALTITGISVEVLLGCLLVVMLVAGFGLTDRVWGKWLAGLTALVMIISILVTIPSGIVAAVVQNERSAAHHDQIEHMNANLMQKYNIALNNPDKGYSDDELASDDRAYNVSFTDGRTTSYYIKWDKTTNEPTVIDKNIPSPQALNETAHK